MWIKTSEARPSPSVPVLAWIDGAEQPFVAEFSGSIWKTADDDDTIGLVDPPPDFWMPLPDAPSTDSLLNTDEQRLAVIRCQLSVLRSDMTYLANKLEMEIGNANPDHPVVGRVRSRVSGIRDAIRQIDLIFDSHQEMCTPSGADIDRVIGEWRRGDDKRLRKLGEMIVNMTVKHIGGWIA